MHALPSSSAIHLEIAHRVLEREGLDADGLFQEAGIGLDTGGLLPQRIPFTQARALNRLCYRELGHRFALRVLDYFNPAMYGALGSAMLFSEDLRDFATRLQRFFPVISTINSVRLEENSAGLQISLVRETAYDTMSREISGVGFMGTVSMFCRLLYRQDFQFHSLAFDFPVDDAGRQLLASHFFPAATPDEWAQRLRFEQPATGAVIDAACLAQPLIGRNRRLAEYHEALVLQQQAEIEADIISRVEATIIRLLEVGHCSADLVARELNMGRRSLHNHLDKKNSGYKQLLEQVRKRLALRYIEDGLPVTEVSERLGYTTNTNFSRAFRQWYGQSPSEYRHSLMAPDKLVG